MDYRKTFKIAYIASAVVDVIESSYYVVKTNTLSGITVLSLMLYMIGYNIINTNDKVHNKNFYIPAIIYLISVMLTILSLVIFTNNIFIVSLLTLDILLTAFMIFINHMIYKQPDDEEKVFIQMPEV